MTGTRNIIRGDDDDRRSFIYFIRSGEFIKIGRSKRWKERLDNMQVGSPHTLIVLLVLVDHPRLEKKLHSRFRASHFRGEWFHSSPALLSYIKERTADCVSKSAENFIQQYNYWDRALNMTAANDNAHGQSIGFMEAREQRKMRAAA